MIQFGKKIIIVTVLIILGLTIVILVFQPRILTKVFSGHSAEKAVYYCPMHTTYTSDRPGSCPICNMTLVKRGPEESDNSSNSMNMQNMPDTTVGQTGQAGQSEPSAHEGHDAMTNSMSTSSAGAMKTFTVEELMKMKPGEICLLHKCKHGTCLIAMTEESARLGKCPHCGEDLGVIVKEAMPQGMAAVKLSPDSQRAVGVETEAVKKKAITKTVRTVGRIAYDPELYRTQQEYLQSVDALKKAEAAEPEIKDQAAQLVESSKIKLRLLGLSPELIKDIEIAGKPDRSLLYSDAGGSVWLYAPIYEYEMPLVKVGDILSVETSSISGKKFEGKIRSIDSVLDPSTRTVRVRAVLENPDGLLKPEMYVNASLQVNLGESVAVPKEAVFMTGENNIVFVSNQTGQYEPRQVKLGVEADNYYQVKSGLSEGELVVTSGNFLIDSESRLKAALQGMGSGGGHQHGA